MNKLPVLVLGLYTPGLSLLRNFSNKGITVFGADCEKSTYGFISKYGKKFYCPDPKTNEEDWLKWMLDFSNNFNEKIVLITTSDRFIISINKYKVTLKQYYNFVLPDNDIIIEMLSKRGLYKLAIANGVTVPKTIFPRSLNDLHKFLDNIKFPIIVKPEYSKDWMQKGIETFVKQQKVLIINNIQEAILVQEKMQELKVPIIFQEIIKGKDENLFYHISYTSKNGELIYSFIGKKIRITPIHFGSASYVEIVNNHRLDNIATTFLRKINYRGICGLEFKYDENDDEFKLIEINPRYGLWDEVGEFIEKDIGYIYYQDMCDSLPEINKPTFRPYYWFSIHRDVSAFLDYKEAKEIKLSEWLKTYQHKPKYFSDIFIDDIAVSLYTIYKVIRKLIGFHIKKLIRKVCK